MLSLRPGRVPREVREATRARLRLLGASAPSSGWLPHRPVAPADKGDTVPQPAAPPPPGEASDDHARRDEPAAGVLVDRLPPTLRGGRMAVDRRAVTVLAAVGAAGVALGASYLWRAQSGPVPVAPPPVLPSTSVSAAPSAVLVHVAGQVHTPGVVSLPAGARVADAVDAAGGAAPGADLSALNLARPVQDGEQIVVPTPGQVPVAGATPGAGTGPGGLLDLNTATAEQLEQLPGVGPVLAQRILDWRERNGRFTSVDELREVNGIGDSKYAEIADKVTV